MSDGFWQALPGIIGAVFAGIVLLRQARNQRHNATKLGMIQEQTDGMNKAMVRLAGEAGEKRGAELGKTADAKAEGLLDTAAVAAEKVLDAAADKAKEIG